VSSGPFPVHFKKGHQGKGWVKSLKSLKPETGRRGQDTSSSIQQREGKPKVDYSKHMGNGETERVRERFQLKVTLTQGEQNRKPG